VLEGFAGALQRKGLKEKKGEKTTATRYRQFLQSPFSPMLLLLSPFNYKLG